MASSDNNMAQVYTVSGLTRQIKNLLEDRYPFVWITGEISNFSTPASGHSYFSLKDKTAVISCVMFKGQKRHLKFNPENGMKIKAMGRISLYEPRGSYQLILEHMEPEGTGSLQEAFDRLKAKLQAQGLFDEKHKKPLPFLPSGIYVITSGTGAAVRDIIQVARQRCPSVPLEIIPVKVQGNLAEYEIAAAIELANDVHALDLIILARGGGSIEDLWAFNTEIVAHAVFQSDLPVISGVGHEIDFTIADFVADLRAPTPSAAVQMALPDQAALLHQVRGFQNNIESNMLRRLQQMQDRVKDLYRRLKSPARVIDDFRFAIEDLEARLFSSVTKRLRHQHENLHWLSRTLENALPLSRITNCRQEVNTLQTALERAFTVYLQQYRDRVREQSAQLAALNPESVLKRGYSITRTPEGQVVMDAKTLSAHDPIEIILSKGRLAARVE